MFRSRRNHFADYKGIIRSIIVAVMPAAAFLAFTVPVFAIEPAQSANQENVFALHPVVAGLFLLGFLVAAFFIWNWSLRRGIASTTAAMSESEIRYRTLIDHSPNGILIHCNYKVVFANQTAANMFHAASLDQIIGCASLDLVHPDEREKLIDLTEPLCGPGDVAV